MHNYHFSLDDPVWHIHCGSSLPLVKGRGARTGLRMTLTVQAVRPFTSTFVPFLVFKKTSGVRRIIRTKHSVCRSITGAAVCNNRKEAVL